jgi:hypothetical protein
MISDDGASGNIETSFWPYGKGFGIQTTTDGQIEPDFSLSGHTFSSVISEAAPSFRLVPGFQPRWISARAMSAKGH